MVAGRTKTAHNRLERRQPIAELVSDCSQRSMVDKVRTQGFVAAMHRVLGLDEELAAAGVLHDGVSTWLIIFTAVFADPVYDTSGGATKSIRRRKVEKPKRKAISERFQPMQGLGARGSKRRQKQPKRGEKQSTFGGVGNEGFQEIMYSKAPRG